MVSLPQEFLALCRQLGDAQQRCSTAMQAQARQIEALTAEVVRLRGAVIVRDTRLALARDELEQLRAASPGLPRRQAMARHISLLAERITSLSRECLRWRQAAQGQAPAALPPVQEPALLATGASMPTARVQQVLPQLRMNDSFARCAQDGQGGESNPSTLDASLAAADLVICQTGCISHDDYWRVQDHCRRTGKPCILVDQPLAALRPMVVLRMAPAILPAASGQPEDIEI